MPIRNRALVDSEFDKNVVRNTVEGMAHFSGTGPLGKVCGDCVWFLKEGVRKPRTRCQKYRDMMNRWGKVDIPAATPSCKYFESKEQSNADYEGKHSEKLPAPAPTNVVAKRKPPKRR